MSIIKIISQINDKSDYEFDIKIEDKYECISYENIKLEFYNNLVKKEKFLEEIDLLDFEKEDIIFESISYFDNDYKGWILLNEEEYISLNNNDKDNEEIIKLLIKVRIKTKSDKDLINQYKNIKKRVEDLSNNIKLNNRNNKNENNENDNENESEIDISVLTANPLIDLEYDKNKNINNVKELRTMNDFNNITNAILNVVIESTKLINAEFYPLTVNNLKKVILHKPKIIHLICKSTYIIPQNENEMKKEDKSFNFVNLLFEDNDYFIMKAIDKDDLDLIFGEDKELKDEKDKKEQEIIKKNIKDIVLIISTQLSQDVYKIVEKYNFKNILVQHTTVSDSLFIADFNEQFYKNIIEQMNINNDNNDNVINQNNEQIIPKINDFFEDAMNININESNQFCCCFHEHKYNCIFMKNLINELYIKNDKVDNKNLSVFFPHFSHLRYKCTNSNNCHMIDFCGHGLCDNNTKSKTMRSCCCCLGIKIKSGNKRKMLINEIEHCLKNIFYKNFNESTNNNEIKFGNKINSFGVIKNLEYIPNYEKMKYIVGRNNIVYEIYQNLFKSEFRLINIYNNRKDYYELNEIADIIIEYLKERKYIIYNEENNDNNNCQLNKEDLQIKREITGKELPRVSLNKNNSELDIRILNSAPIQLEWKKNEYNFEKMILNKKNDFNYFRMKDKNKSNLIYFIITFDDILSKDIINSHKHSNSPHYIDMNEGIIISNFK